MENAFYYVQYRRNLETSSTYPYLGKDGVCKTHKNVEEYSINGMHHISHGTDQFPDQTQLDAKLQIGPVSVAVEAKGFAFQHYTGGVITETNKPNDWQNNCGSNVDHGVLIVGYGVQKEQGGIKDIPYYIVKNSWGKEWGEDGYLRIGRYNPAVNPKI